MKAKTMVEHAKFNYEEEVLKEKILALEVELYALREDYHGKPKYSKGNIVKEVCSYNNKEKTFVILDIVFQHLHGASYICRRVNKVTFCQTSSVTVIKSFNGRGDEHTLIHEKII